MDFIKKHSGDPNNVWNSKLVGKYIVDDNSHPHTEEQVFYKRDLPTHHRILPPNAMRTMDYRPERLNIHVNADKKVTGVNYG
ncbi:unnamed protein product [Cunninghamella blakesleeana]